MKKIAILLKELLSQVLLKYNQLLDIDTLLGLTIQ